MGYPLKKCSCEPNYALCKRSSQLISNGFCAYSSDLGEWVESAKCFANHLNLMTLPILGVFLLCMKKWSLYEYKTNLVIQNE
jgi:hypothetical protein